MFANEIANAGNSKEGDYTDTTLGKLIIGGIPVETGNGIEAEPEPEQRHEEH
jgi:hypothetical protein